MPKQLVQTGLRISRDYSEVEMPTINRATDLIGVVLEAPGSSDDRFYFVTGLLGEKQTGQTSFNATVQLSQMREVEAPHWYQDWRKVYKSILVGSLLAERTAFMCDR